MNILRKIVLFMFAAIFLQTVVAQLPEAKGTKSNYGSTLLIADAIPQSYLWIIPNSGHSTPENYAKQFNETINDFFKKPFR